MAGEESHQPHSRERPSTFSASLPSDRFHSRTSAPFQHPVEACARGAWHNSVHLCRMYRCNMHIHIHTYARRLPPLQHPTAWLHELGHNLYLNHAGSYASDGANGLHFHAYKDDACAMGHCCLSRCFNAPHSLQLGWASPLAVLHRGSLQPGVCCTMALLCVCCQLYL